MMTDWRGGAYAVRTTRLVSVTRKARTRIVYRGDFAGALAVFLKADADSMIERADLIMDGTGRFDESAKEFAAWLNDPEAE